MKQPEGFDDGSGRVCSLKRALYGAAQSSRAFNWASSKDFCLVYVDDGLLATSSEKLAQEFLKELKETFELTSRLMDYFLGVHIKVSEDRRRIQINQSKYIQQLLDRSQMTDWKPSPVPIDVTSKAAYEGEIDLSIDFRSIVGGLMYANLGTRCDLSFCVGFFSSYLDKPTKHPWNTALKALRYL